MKRRLLGRTDLAVSEVGFGAWAIGGNRHGSSYDPTDDADFTPDYIRFAVAQSLARPRTGYIDLLQLHNPPLQKGGGVAAVQSTMPDAVQLVHNLVRRESEGAPARRPRGGAASSRSNSCWTIPPCRP